MLAIQELTDRENQLMERVRGVVGSMNEKADQLTEIGVFNAYRVLHHEYASLAKTGNLEALKRAFFIQWYAVTEPACFTGIPGADLWGDDKGLELDTERAVIDLVAQLIDSDDELRWMAAWYYQIADYYFESFWGNSAIIKNLGSYHQETDSLLNSPRLIDEPLEKRGQMGAYFLSILKSHANRAK